MNEGDNFSLVPMPPGALGTAEPGKKHIISGMVTETLALAQKGRKDHLKIVLVDDESWLREWLGSLIEAWFPKVTLSSFEDGSEAWNHLAQEAPDLLITDMNRPGLSGWKMLPMLAERNPDYHILVHSGCTNERSVRNFAGPYLNLTFLRKPWNAEDLHLILSNLLTGKPDFNLLVRLTQPWDRLRMRSRNAAMIQWIQKAAKQGTKSAKQQL